MCQKSLCILTRIFAPHLHLDFRTKRDVKKTARNHKHALQFPLVGHCTKAGLRQNNMSVVAPAGSFPASLSPRPFWVFASVKDGKIIASESPVAEKVAVSPVFRIFAETENLAVEKVQDYLGWDGDIDN